MTQDEQNLLLDQLRKYKVAFSWDPNKLELNVTNLNKAPAYLQSAFRAQAQQIATLCWNQYHSRKVIWPPIGKHLNDRLDAPFFPIGKV